MVSRKKGSRKKEVKEKIASSLSKDNERKADSLKDLEKEDFAKQEINENQAQTKDKGELREEVSVNDSDKKEELKESVVKEPEQLQPRKKGVRVLVILIIILLIIDIASIYFYYNPDLSKFTDFFKFKSGRVVDEDNIIEKCSDGTALNSCSKNKPYYCYERQLIKKAATCGCASGYTISFQDCKKIT